MTDDGALLKQYKEAGSEEAFAELVRRHLDLVYSAALRNLGGDVHLARDVSQTVFIDLARKASRLSNRPALCGWLYTSACFAASKAVRSQRRRLAREQAADTMREVPSDPQPETDWNLIRPVLDALMLDLKETDREALLLRFFQRQSLAEVGGRLGLTENAARMRVERALERLRRLLARRGISSAGAALALVLTQQAVVAAPGSLASAITTTALTAAVGASTISALNLITLMKTNTIVLGLLIAAGSTSLVLQHQSNLRLRDEVAGLRGQLAQPPPAAPRASESADNTELERLRRDNAELIRLRGEVAGLRAQLAAPPNSPEAAARNKQARMANEFEEAKILLAKAPEIPMVPARHWANVGFGSPAAALQTLNWSTAHRDTNAFSNALMWDTQAKARADALFAAAPESVRQQYGTIDNFIFDWWLNNSTPIAAARVLSQIDEGPEAATLVEQHVYNDGRVRENTVQFERDANGQWRQVIPSELMPKLDFVLNNPAPQSSGGK